MGRRGGLGKGLGALIPTGEPEPGGAALRELAIDQIEPNTYQPRAIFEDEPLESLTASIRALGVLQPVLVRPAGDHFELIAGERRWRAARAAGLTTIPAIVRETADDGALEQALVENLHREDLTAIEEAAAYQQLAEDFGLRYEDIAARVGKSKSAVANTLRLLQLPPEIQQQVNDRRLSAGHARALLAIDDLDEQLRLAAQTEREGWSVRHVEEIVRRRTSGEGATAPSPRARRADGDRPASLLELEHLLSELLDTRVQVQMGARQRGRIVVEFADLVDLERIYRAMTAGPERDPDAEHA